MEAKNERPSTNWLTVDPEKLLKQFPNISPNLRQVAEGCARNGQDVRVEFLIVPAFRENQYIPISAMPAVKEARHA